MCDIRPPAHVGDGTLNQGGYIFAVCDSVFFCASSMCLCGGFLTAAAAAAAAAALSCTALSESANEE